MARFYSAVDALASNVGEIGGPASFIGTTN